jgi:predicted transcriptional regulator
MNTALQIKPELQAKLEILAHTTHRDSEELVNEALELYLQTAGTTAKSSTNA